MKPISVRKSFVGRLAALCLAIIVLSTFVPAASAQGNGACPNPYTVRARDTLSTIAEKCGVTTNALRAANLKTIRDWNGNRGDDNTIHPGQTLSIPKAAPARTSPWKFHTVKKDETLPSIAKLYGRTTWQLIKWNVLIPLPLKVGRVIRYQ